LTDETQKVRHYSALQYADDPKGPNLSLTDFFDGVPTSVGVLFSMVYASCYYL